MKRLEISRGYSYLIIAVIYLLATVIGVVAYNALNYHYAINLLIADVLATVVVYIFSLIFSNASVYDPYWSVQPPVIVTLFAITYGLNALGIALVVPICWWAMRLTANWAYTFRGMAYQDWRYTMLNEKTKGLYPIVNLIGIHMVPTLVVYACVLPVVFAIVEGWTLNLHSIIFALLAIASATMQGIADIQMHKHRNKKVGGYIRDGLWKYSRHPNYLGEILTWWCIGLAVYVSSGVVALLVGAILNTLLFLFVSIPMADNRQSAKDGWEEYKRQTHALLPIYKRQ